MTAILNILQTKKCVLLHEHINTLKNKTKLKKFKLNKSQFTHNHNQCRSNKNILMK